MRRGHSTGTPTKAEAARMTAIKAGPCLACMQRGIDLSGQGLVEVPGFPHTYASNEGDIYSDHPGNRWGGRLHKLKPADNGRGYLRVRCHGKSRCVHLLVAAAFHGEKPEGMEVNHKDGVKANNRPENLEYVTRAENVLHCHRIGLGNPAMGGRHPRSKVTAEQVREMRSEYADLRVGGRLPDGEMKRMQVKYGMSESGITAICKRKTWRSVE